MFWTQITPILASHEPAQFQSTLDQAIAFLKSGQVIAFPTETVYGLGANALNDIAVRKIFSVKGRPSDNPLIVHVASLSMLEEVAVVDDDFYPLLHHFWPGPITFIFEKRRHILPIVSGGLNTVAVRIPSHPVALKLIEQCGFPIAAPSANTSGRPSPTTAEMVMGDLRGKIPLILDGGPCEFGLESTVVDLSTKHPRILRPGIITPSDLQPYLSEEINYIHANGQEPIQSPGMKYRHYKPNLQIIVFSEVEKITKLIQDENAKKPFIIFTQADCKSDFTSLTFLDLNELACELYHLFFTMEKERYDLLLIQRIDAVGIGETLMNRILKAADRMD